MTTHAKTNAVSALTSASAQASKQEQLRSVSHDHEIVHEMADKSVASLA